jgi:Ser/Thr protein kinase RdoA (MazF antagonist)
MRRASAIQSRTNDAPLRSSAQRAIEQALTPDVLQRAASFWNAPLDSLSALRGVQNFVYALDLPGAPSILRLTHESHRRVDEVEAELCWINDLAARKLNVTPPRRSRAGALLEVLESRHGRFIATCFERARGVPLDPTDPVMANATVFENLGAMIGALHNAARERAWTERSLSRPNWREESVVRNFKLYVPETDALTQRGFDRALREFDSLPRSRESYGLIHGDLNHANLFVADGQLTAFDFDDSCFFWFAYDLAVAIYHLPPAENQEVTNENARRIFRSLISGYQRVAPFEPDWLERIPLFLKWRDLLIYGFYYEQLAIDSLPERLQKNFVAMRERIEADRPIADISAGA